MERALSRLSGPAPGIDFLSVPETTSAWLFASLVFNANPCRQRQTDLEDEPFEAEAGPGSKLWKAQHRPSRWRPATEVLGLGELGLP